MQCITKSPFSLSKVPPLLKAVKALKADSPFRDLHLWLLLLCCQNRTFARTFLCRRQSALRSIGHEHGREVVVRRPGSGFVTCCESGTFRRGGLHPHVLEGLLHVDRFCRFGCFAEVRGHHHHILQAYLGLLLGEGVGGRRGFRRGLSLLYPRRITSKIVQFILSWSSVIGLNS